MSKSKIFLSSALILLLIFFSVSYVFALRINTSASMPIGIYRAVTQPIEKGSLVEVCLPLSVAKFGKDRGYIGAGSCADNTEPVLKQIAGVGGDMVQVTAAGVRINDQLLPHSDVLNHDEKLWPLISQIAKVTKKLNSDEVWLYGIGSKKSWDSRYYGAIKINSIRAVVVPVLTWKKEQP